MDIRQRRTLEFNFPKSDWIVPGGDQPAHMAGPDESRDEIPAVLHANARLIGA
jgi:hypothetical protein